MGDTQGNYLFEMDENTEHLLQLEAVRLEMEAMSQMVSTLSEQAHRLMISITLMDSDLFGMDCIEEQKNICNDCKEKMEQDWLKVIQSCDVATVAIPSSEK